MIPNHTNAVRSGFRKIAHVLSIAALVAAFNATPLANAAAIFSSAARSTFTLDPIGPVTSITDHSPSTTISLLGTGVASIDTFTASADGIHPATISSAVSGSASAPPASSAFAEAKRGHVFVVPRVSPTGPLPTIALRFTFAIAWDTHLAIDLPGSEFSEGGAYFAISGFEPGIDAIALDPGMPGAIVPHASGLGWEFNPNYDTLAGSPVDEVHALTITGTITVFAGMVGEFAVITDTSGFAGARVVPLPSTLALLLAALAWPMRKWIVRSR